MNTAPACVLGALLCKLEETVLTVPADHIILYEDRFWNAFDIAIGALMDFGGLFTFGITPTRAETGYGYIEMGKEVSDGVFHSKNFKEKPNHEKAKKYFEKGDFLWNSGMFLWKAGDLITEMKKHAPGVTEPLEGLDPRDSRALEMAYRNVEKVSVDHALMERSSNVMVIPADPGWSDVGSWASIRELIGYTKAGRNRSIEGSERVFIKAPDDRKVAVIGLEDIIVVETEEGILVLNEKFAQDVRSVFRSFMS
jgi:mannose-1-phosphate guanylyltransferase